MTITLSADNVIVHASDARDPLKQQVALSVVG
jgi:hypothetical protein